ncbi:cell division protein ZapE [Pedomonas mirosovicensis]|uniref:cell division protein ZapE n=1 Tax=Pedomonas mirosovicensis TaxID=2908641 RepID=UPI002169BF5B|nr:cell division protein ZapE [Pedomonas mirosovicensis]MCH8684634.1 AFG1 family ATPase [Pedomonas mirosovicensis]
MSVIAAYQDLVARSELRPDPDQARIAARLDGLARALEAWRPQSSSSWFGRLFGGGREESQPPRGLYMWGSVGRGKSMLMDLFHDNVKISPKRRVHFHEFMLEAHAAIHNFRQMDEAGRREAFGRNVGDDPIPPVAAKIAEGARLLCFDEMQVTDVADAMILGRLFTELFRSGVVVVTTSNRPPRDLYKNGLNRQLFLPFIDLLEETLDVETLNGPTDYRLDRLGGMPVYYVPNGPEATAKLSEAFFRLTDYAVEDRQKVPSETLTVQGREILVPKALKGVAVFSFKRLCANPLGPADYLAIAQRYHTVIIVGIPKLGPEKRNEAKRFVTLIDALYEYRVKLLCAADAPPQELYTEGDGAFEFERTVSRLMEMQSADYLAEGHGIAA